MLSPTQLTSAIKAFGEAESIKEISQATGMTYTQTRRALEMLRKGNYVRLEGTGHKSTYRATTISTVCLSMNGGFFKEEALAQEATE